MPKTHPTRSCHAKASEGLPDDRTMHGKLQSSHQQCRQPPTWRTSSRQCRRPCWLPSWNLWGRWWLSSPRNSFAPCGPLVVVLLMRQPCPCGLFGWVVLPVRAPGRSSWGTRKGLHVYPVKRYKARYPCGCDIKITSPVRQTCPLRAESSRYKLVRYPAKACMPTRWSDTKRGTLRVWQKNLHSEADCPLRAFCWVVLPVRQPCPLWATMLMHITIAALTFARLYRFSIGLQRCHLSLYWIGFSLQPNFMALFSVYSQATCQTLFHWFQFTDFIALVPVYSRTIGQTLFHWFQSWHLSNFIS